jgi:hypothetical protein
LVHITLDHRGDPGPSATQALSCEGCLRAKHPST